LLNVLPWMVLVLAAPGAADPVDLVKKYLAAPEKARVSMLPDALQKALTDTPVACAVPAERAASDAKLSASAGDPQRVVVDWRPAKGEGALRTALLVKDGKVLDVRVFNALAETRLLDGDANGALRWANTALQFDPGNAAANVMAARVAARLGDFARAEKSLVTAREQSPECRVDVAVAAYDLALLQHRGPEAEEARTACLEMVRAGQFMDGRCFALRAQQLRGRENAAIKGELEEALGRNPSDPWLKAELGMLALVGKPPERTQQAQAHLQLREALSCPAGVESASRAPAYNAVAALALELRANPCAADAERAVVLDPTQAEFRRTLSACADGTLLWANVENRRAAHVSSVDQDVEGRAVVAALMQEKPVVGGRKLPAYQAYTRVRVGVRVKEDRLDVTLSNVNAPRRKTREEDAVAAAFMVHTVYVALYGEDAPRVTTVRVQYAGDNKEYSFTLPDEMKPVWRTALPTDKELEAMVERVKVRVGE
jgi:hypothetical protein